MPLGEVKADDPPEFGLRGEDRGNECSIAHGPDQTRSDVEIECARLVQPDCSRADDLPGAHVVALSSRVDPGHPASHAVDADRLELPSGGAP